jgi:hypothetical protein
MIILRIAYNKYKNLGIFFKLSINLVERNLVRIFLLCLIESGKELPPLYPIRSTIYYVLLINDNAWLSILGDLSKSPITTMATLLSLFNSSC